MNRLALLVLAPIAFVAPSLIDPLGIAVSDLTRTVAFTIALAGLSVVLGFTGLLSIGHAALVGIGAYATAILVDRIGLSFFVAVPLAVVVGVGAGALLGLPSLRVSGLQLALVTFTIATAFPRLVNRFDWLTGGPGGYPVKADVVVPDWLGELVDDAPFRYYLALLLAAGVFWAMAGVLRSRLGRAWQAVRDNPTAAAAVGVPVGPYRVAAFAVGGGLAALGGAIILADTPFVVASQYGPFDSIALYAALVIAGTRSPWGPLLGAGIVILLPELVFRSWGLGAEEWIIPTVLIVLTFLRPQGILKGATTSVDRHDWLRLRAETTSEPERPFYTPISRPDVTR